ncbi:hypothetical protein NMY22_g1157 [Coprinellus aureogranulatus]|nr:hypothetical protein NMY22_g1157 [Coprinellus aureogranulatus]
MPQRRRTGTGEGEEEVHNADSSNETPITRSDIWLEDGSIVIQAEQTQFKVHRGLLARVSPIFADVFSVPQPAQGDLMVEGCPVLHLQDSARDITHLLSTLYDLRYHTKQPIPFEVASALLRLGRKYEIKQLFQEIVCRLKTDLPTTLVEADNQPDPNNWKEIDNEINIIYDIVELILASNFSELHCVLPITYFWCCAERIDEMVQGTDYEHEDGSMVTSKPTLPPDAQRACLAGRQKLIDRFNVVFSWVDTLPTTECSSFVQCSKLSRALVNALWRPEPGLVRLIDTWSWLTKYLADHSGHPVDLNQLCAFCSTMAKEKYESYREETWDQLPSYFGLPGWDVLNKKSEDTEQ